MGTRKPARDCKASALGCQSAGSGTTPLGSGMRSASKLIARSWGCVRRHSSSVMAGMGVASYVSQAAWRRSRIHWGS